MRHVFYHLRSPGALHSDPPPTYGRPQWATRYPRVRWGGRVRVRAITCPRDPGHVRSGGRIGDLEVILSSHRVGDFMWSHSECLVTDRVAELFRDAGLTGYELRPVTVKIPRARSDGAPPPRLWDLVATGRAMVHPDSGIKLLETCEACGFKRFSSYMNGIIVDEAQWDGSDFFTVEGYRDLLLVTSRVADLITEHQLTNCILTPSHQLRWDENVRRPEDWLESKRALAQKPLNELLELLDSTDAGIWWLVAGTLADSLEWRAVEHLIKGFERNDPLIAEWAAMAVGKIAGHAETPQNVREAILERLRQLLTSEDPEIRHPALKALGVSQLESIKPDVRQCLFDPDPEIRQTALLLLGFMQDTEARPLAEERLRDPNPAVRADARRALADLELGVPPGETCSVLWPLLPLL